MYIVEYTVITLINISKISKLEKNVSHTIQDLRGSYLSKPEYAVSTILFNFKKHIRILTCILAMGCVRRDTVMVTMLERIKSKIPKCR